MNRLRLAMTGGLALLLTAVGFGALAPSVRTAEALTNCTVSATDAALDGEELALVGLINDYRAANGGGTLKRSANQERAAAWMANDLSLRSVFSHTDSLGRDPSVRAVNCDYPSANATGENIGAGTFRSGAQSQFDAWRASPGHNANMLDSRYRVIGVGHAFQQNSTYRHYWVADFGLVDDSATPPPPPPPTNTPAAMVAPAPGTTLPGDTATFTWSTGSNAASYRLRVGSTFNGTDYLDVNTGLATNQQVAGLPLDGRTIYVRLTTLFAAGPQTAQYTYTAATSGGGSGGTVDHSIAEIQTPAPGSIVSGGSARVVWSAGLGAQRYRIDVGTTPGGRDIGRVSFPSTTRSATTSGLPTDGRTIYVRMWTRISLTLWKYNDYTYTTGP